MAQVGTGTQKGSVNVELNIVPFIDLMSCLTAFLLVTAVWVNTAHLKNEAAGKAAGEKSEDKVTLAILIQWDQMLVTARPSGETRQLAAYDWGHLGDALKELQPAGGETPHVEIAADSSNAHPIEYQQLIAAMDTSLRAGFPDVGVTDPTSLSR